MIKPTVGRVVWYYAGGGTEKDGQQPLAAIIAHVESDRSVNLCVISRYGVPVGVADVPLLQEGEKAMGHFCRWMPYQLGQAAKTEQLAERLVTLGSSGDKQSP